MSTTCQYNSARSSQNSRPKRIIILKIIYLQIHEVHVLLTTLLRHRFNTILITKFNLIRLLAKLQCFRIESQTEGEGNRDISVSFNLNLLIF